jgi:hypothetical protein
MIIKFERNPKTEFAIDFNYYIYENILNNIDIEYIKSIILKKESEIIKNYPSYGDGQTGLGDKSLTSRYYYYNLLSWPEMFDLKKSIRNSHDLYLKELNFNFDRELYIQCWANVMRKGQIIKSHIHHIGEETYLGGHICISAINTNTYYIDPFNKKSYEDKNIPGKITLFPGWLGHYTDEVKDEQTRITIAFDICKKEHINNFEKSGVWIKL